MKKFLPLFLTGLYLTLGVTLQAQLNTFSKMYTDSLGIGIQVHSVVPSFDHGYIISGKAILDRGLIIKLDSAGNLRWNKTIGSNTGNYKNYFFNSIIATTDSCYMLSGSVFDSVLNKTNAVCFKMDSNGNLLWSKTIKQANYNINANYSIQTFDSGYVITGEAIKNNINSVFIAKLDYNGSLQWTNILSAAGSNSFGYAVKQMQDSGFIIAGSIRYSAEGVLLLKTTSTGIFSWAHRYSSSQPYFKGNDVIVTDDGILTYINARKSALLKTDFSGNMKWSWLYAGDPNTSPICRDCPPPKLIKTLERDYVFVSGACAAGGYFTKVDSNGNIKWSEKLQLIPLVVIETKKKEFFIVGNGPMCGISPGTLAPQIGVIKTDSLGQAQSCNSNFSDLPEAYTKTSSPVIFTSVAGGQDTTIIPPGNSIAIQVYDQCVNIIPGIKEVKTKSEVRLLPNPSAGDFDIINTSSEPFQINIFNSLGENIHQSERDTVVTGIDLTSKPAGIYFYVILFSNKEIASGKLIIVK